MKTKKYQKLRRLIINVISDKDLYIKTEDDSSSLQKEKYDYYVEFVKHGDNIISCGDVNVILFVDKTSDKKDIFTLIFSLPNRDDNNYSSDSRLSSKIFEIVKVVEDLLGCFDYVRVQDSDQFTYIHIVKQIDPDILFKLKLKSEEK